MKMLDILHSNWRKAKDMLKQDGGELYRKVLACFDSAFTYTQLAVVHAPYTNNQIGRCLIKLNRIMINAYLPHNSMEDRKAKADTLLGMYEFDEDMKLDETSLVFINIEAAQMKTCVDQALEEFKQNHKVYEGMFVLLVRTETRYLQFFTLEEYRNRGHVGCTAEAAKACNYSFRMIESFRGGFPEFVDMCYHTDRMLTILVSLVCTYGYKKGPKPPAAIDTKPCVDSSVLISNTYTSKAMQIVYTLWDAEFKINEDASRDHLSLHANNRNLLEKLTPYQTEEHRMLADFKKFMADNCPKGCQNIPDRPYIDLADLDYILRCFESFLEEKQCSDTSTIPTATEVKELLDLRCVPEFRGRCMLSVSHLVAEVGNLSVDGMKSTMKYHYTYQASQETQEIYKITLVTFTSPSSIVNPDTVDQIEMEFDIRKDDRSGYFVAEPRPGTDVNIVFKNRHSTESDVTAAQGIATEVVIP